MRLRDEVRQLIATVLELPLELVAEDAESMAIKEWDSLNHLRICMAIEDRFETSIPMEEMLTLDSVPNIVLFLKHSGCDDDHA